MLRKHCLHDVSSSGLVNVVTNPEVEARWNVMAHAQKPDFVFQQNGRVHLKLQGRQFSWLLAAQVYASAVVMLVTPWSKVVFRVLATHSIRQLPPHFPTHASPCAITFQLESTTKGRECKWLYTLISDVNHINIYLHLQVCYLHTSQSYSITVLECKFCYMKYNTLNFNHILVQGSECLSSLWLENRTGRE